MGLCSGGYVWVCVVVDFCGAVYSQWWICVGLCSGGFVWVCVVVDLCGSV